MTTLKDLIIAENWAAVEGTFGSLYPEETTKIEGYQNVFEYIKAHPTAPNEKNIRIVVDHIVHDKISNKDIPVDEQFYAVCGKNGMKIKDEQYYDAAHDTHDVGENEVEWGLELSTFEQWGGYEIDEQTLLDYHRNDIISHCLYEMTFFGFNNDTILNTKNDLNGRVEELDKWEKEGTLDQHTSTMEQVRERIDKIIADNKADKDDEHV